MPPPAPSSFDAERAARELRIAQKRLLDEAGHAQVSEDTLALHTLAGRYLWLAQQHYRAGRYYQAAEVATAAARLADAVRHLFWAARTN